VGKSVSLTFWRLQQWYSSTIQYTNAQAWTLLAVCFSDHVPPVQLRQGKLIVWPYNIRKGAKSSLYVYILLKIKVSSTSAPSPTQNLSTEASPQPTETIFGYISCLIIFQSFGRFGKVINIIIFSLRRRSPDWHPSNCGYSLWFLLFLFSAACFCICHPCTFCYCVLLLLILFITFTQGIYIYMH
jgi:hypothetical protein